MSGYSNTIEAIAWFNAYIVDGCNTEPVPPDWDQYLHDAKAYYAIAHGHDAEEIAHEALPSHLLSEEGESHHGA